MTTTADGAYRYRALDAWRGICAVLVTFVHVPVAHAWQPANAYHSLQLLVDFFFVLSGFVICHAYGNRLWVDRDWPGFMIRRFGRVYPLHLAVLAAFVAIELLKAGSGLFMSLPLEGVPFTGNRSVATLVSNLFLTQSFNLHGIASWNIPAWSISVEFYSYIVFAVAVLIAGRNSVGFAVLAALGLAAVAAFSPTWLFTTHDYGFWRCLYGFFLGCLVCNAVDTLRKTRLIDRLGQFGTQVEIAAVTVLAAYMALTGVDASSLAAPLVFAVIVFVFAFERGAISRQLLTTPAQALGLWSYSIYMIHALIFALLKIVMTALAKVPALGISASTTDSGKLWSLGNPAADAGLVAICLALVLIASKYTFEWIESPARAWFSKLADRVSANAANTARSRGSHTPARESIP